MFAGLTSVFVNWVYCGMYRSWSSKISSGITMLGRPFFCSSIGTMFANLLALYFAAIKAVCSINGICAFVLGVMVFVWGRCGAGRVKPGGGMVLDFLVVGVLVSRGLAVVAYVVCLFCFSACLLVFSMFLRVGQDPLTATCCPSQLQHLIGLLHVEKKWPSSPQRLHLCENEHECLL